ncbi:FAD dependent oxidoreductase [Sodiomyces alkalinus F11]|uniref:D-amino-acid oxidase n=1 Tax=Sodiomyces alkalinus (strain CBS 110278 / VKM F-3762 / F11) TaxID=1314773 RepID=A0A3N2Q832_SODAK|nr:FAD dependent oxidoreductase [Sodiomyces alkalinus F11]ROT42924.1 FAD dependent oxidoreductase [Sodiomyces alkalinus F11]
MRPLSLAGVIGLTSALLLAEDPANSVTIVSKHMPGDYDIEYTSPWAGANFMPMSFEENSRWERRTWPVLKKLAEEVPEAGIHFQRVQVYRRDKDIITGAASFDGLFVSNPWFGTLFDDYRELPPDELPPTASSGCEWTSVCINTAIYLPWLVGRCRRHGVVLKRAVLSHIREAKELHHTGRPADVIVNATGLLASRLGGVEDQSVVPARGQIVVVRNEVLPMATISGTEDGEKEVCYMMTRAAGGGTVLGGTYDVGNWDANPDPNIAVRIMKRCIELNPSLTGGKGIEALDIIRHGVGLRPYRKGGVRIEADRSILEDGTPVVHNYGHAGWGFQGSFGCAEKVVELVQAIQTQEKAKL